MRGSLSGRMPAPASEAKRKTLAFGQGAIAQLGERVLCKHELVGSIPSGSTRASGSDPMGAPDRSAFSEIVLELRERPLPRAMFEIVKREYT